MTGKSPAAAAADRARKHAAPTYFAPEKVRLTTREGVAFDGAFVDGGVSPFNDPALQLLMLAALQGHGFNWMTGRDKLLIISVGTGAYRPPRTVESVMNSVTAQQGIMALQSLMDDCDRVNRSMLQWLTSCLTPWIIDRAVRDMKLDSANGPQLATYVRYQCGISSPEWLKGELNLDLSADQVAQIARMDDPSHMDQLSALGQATATKQVKDEHLTGAFNLA